MIEGHWDIVLKRYRSRVFWRPRHEEAEALVTRQRAFVAGIDRNSLNRKAALELVGQIRKGPIEFQAHADAAAIPSALVKLKR